jgi:prepilin peptidase CpaA
LSNVQYFAVAVFSALALLGAFLDLRSRRIPNVLSVALAISGISATWLIGGAAAAGSAFLHLLIALVIGMVLYALKMWGGGDAKFYAGTAAWFTLDDLPRLFLSISLAGLVLLTVWFGSRRLARRGAPSDRGGELPYGVAIAAGGLVILVAQAL